MKTEPENGIVADLNERKAQFDSQGYCTVANLFTSEELGEIEDFFEVYRTTGGKAFDKDSSYDEIDPSQRQLRAMQPHRYSRKVKEWFLNPRVAAVLEHLLGRPALGAQTMYYYKPPGARGQGMHQDNFYLLAQPATCIAAWTPIDDADEENGCLWVVPGSQDGEIYCPEKKGEKWLSYGDSHITRFPRDTKPIPVPVKRGETLFFGGHLIHGSGPNRSKTRSRRTFIGHYVDDASTEVSRFYHPILDMQGNVASHVEVTTGGGPCGDGWFGAVH